MIAPELIDVPVAGGDLRVAHWGAPRGDAPVVLLIHGITSSHLAWARVAEELGGECTLYAPDLRGRGASRELPGPFGMAAHSDDLMALLDHVRAERATLVGQSMGGFVVANAAARYPGRTAAVLLVDGGLKIAGIPEGVDLDAVIQAVIGPAMDRLRMTFPTREAYRDYWRAHPALAEDWDEYVEAYIDYDLVGQEPELRPATNIDAVREDSEDTLVNPMIDEAPRAITAPALFLRAERGMLGAPPPLYGDEATLPVLATMPNLRHEMVADVNHYTITMGKRGAAVVADRVRDLAGGS